MIVYYGRREEIQSHLLYNLKTLQVLPSTENLAGFYLIEFKYGKKTVKKINLNINNDTAEDEVFLIYRYLSDEESLYLENAGTNLQYYILAHKMLDNDYLKSKVLSKIDDAVFIAGDSNATYIRSAHDVKLNFNTRNIYILKAVDNYVKEKVNEKSSFHWPVILLFFIKAILNPINEIKQYATLIQYSNLRIIQRFIELILFMDFLVKSTVYPIVYSIRNFIYYNLRHISLFIGRFIYYNVGYNVRHISLFIGRFIYYNVRHVSLLIGRFIYYIVGYNVRHVSLLIGRFIYYKIGYFFYYKIGYFFYDRVTYFFYYKIYYNVRHISLFIGRFIYYRLGYGLRHIFYLIWRFIYFGIIFKFIHFSIVLKNIIIYKSLHFVYYRVGYFLYYRVGYFLYNRLIYVAQFIHYSIILSLFYTFRHFSIMTYFKIYGLAYDLVMFLHRFTKLVLLYPFFKIYWFCRFQYNKRIKKYFKRNVS